MKGRRSDTVLLVLTGVWVAGLALVAGAISFAHMQALASAHDQVGWKSYAFPISVDGLEIVSSLYVVAQRRAGRPVGWIPWVALVVGTLASLSANIGVGGADLIGKALAGWPALSMLVSVKLLFSMFDHDQPDVRDVRDVRGRLAVDGTVLGTVPLTEQVRPGSSEPAAAVPADDRAPSAIDLGDHATLNTAGHASSDAPPAGSADRTARGDVRAVAHLVPAARAAHARLTQESRSLSRDALAMTMRRDGHSVSNASASLLLRVLQAEAGVTPFATASGRASPAMTDAIETVHHVAR